MVVNNGNLTEAWEKKNGLESSHKHILFIMEKASSFFVACYIRRKVSENVLFLWKLCYNNFFYLDWKIINEQYKDKAVGMRLGHQGELKDNFGGDKREVVQRQS